jgi:hypothetical protein
MATRTAIPVYRIETLTLAAERLAGFEASWLAECEHETENIKLRAIADVAISRAEAAEKRERAYREALAKALVANGWPLCRMDGCEYPPTFYSAEYPSGVCPEHAPESEEAK